METNLPKHICVFITHNEHKLSYDTVTGHLEFMCEEPDFETKESRQRCIDTDELWTMQWYPNTPVGFIEIAAPTLEELLKYCDKVKEEEGD